VKHRNATLLAVLLAAGLVLGASAQEKRREAQLRTVRGTVLDKEENPIAGGVVFLKNLRTQNVRSQYSDDEGKYRFSGLDPNVDYEVHAEHREQTSQRRTISSLDGRREIILHLKVDKKKDAG
jgi:protocatechuate 3,4-dioxygenase beta subunit